MSNLHSTCSDQHLDEKKRKKNLFEILLFNSFTLTEINSDFRQKLLIKGCRNRFLHVLKTIQGNRFIDFFRYWYIFGLWAKFFWHLPKNDPQSWENCFLGVQTNTSVEKFLWKTLLQFFVSFWAKYFLIFGKSFTGRLSKPFSTWSGNFSRQQIFSIFFCSCYIFGFWAKVLWHLAQIFLLCCQICFLRNQTKTLMKRDDFWKLFFSKFEQIYSWLLRKINLQSWQNCFLSIRTNTLVYNQQLHWKILLLLLAFGRIYLWVFEFFFFLQNCENCFLKRETNTSIKNTFFWKLLLKVFRNRIETFSSFRQKILGKFVRTVIYVFKNMLKKKIFQFFFFLLCSRTLSKIFLTFGIKFSTKLSKLLSTCSDEHFDEKRGFENLVFFRKFSKMFSKFWQELFGKVVRTVF